MRSRLLLLALLLTPATARADLLPPGTGCDGKQVNDACTAFWKEPSNDPANGMPRGQTGPGRCLEESVEVNRQEKRVVTCRPLATPGTPGVTYADSGCAGRREGEACAVFNDPYDGKGTGGACVPKTHPDHGKVLACDRSRTPSATASGAASAAAPAPARSSEVSAGREASKSCSCEVPGGAGSGGAAGLVAVAAALVGRWGRGVGRARRASAPT